MANIVLEKPQKKLGMAGMVLFIGLMDMFIPLSTDMYLPALPTMGAHLNTSDSLVNISVTGFFFAYAIGMLLWGPLSDKYGRKKPLLFGFLLYTFASFLCMISWNITMLIGSRIFQGIGAASVTAISMAMVKDCFSGKTRETVLAVVQTFSGFGPIFAPIIGSWLLLITDWRGIFLLLLLFGIVGILFTLLYQESLAEEERLTGSVFQTFGQLGVMLHNRSFIGIVLIYSIIWVPFYAYLTMSSYIYVNQFGCTEQTYSYYYAVCALLSMAGPYLYIRFLQKCNKNILTYFCFGVSALSGVGAITIGTTAPYYFCFMIFLYYLTTNALRPFSTNLILEQQKNDIGTASSIMNMSFNLFGCIGMLFASFPFRNMAVAIGVMIMIASIIAIVGWCVLVKTTTIREFYD